MVVFQAVVALVTLYWLNSISRIFRNYFKARNCGFPIFISPVDMSSPFWLGLSPLLLPLAKRFLPSAIWRPLDLSSYGLEWRDHVAARTRPSAYFLIGPGELDLFLEDPVLVNTVIAKRKQYPGEATARKIMGVVGPNLSSSDGEDWQRQRRLLAPILNERIMNKVWMESQTQAGDMLDSFMKDGGTTTGTIPGLRKIAFNILQYIGYGVPQGWGEISQEVPEGHHMAYMEALHELIDGFLIVALGPGIKVLTLPFMPNVIKRKGWALEDFLIYTQEMLEKERKTAINSDKPRNNLLSLLATMSDRNSIEKSIGLSSAEKQSLSDEEITGNLYNFTLAGFDTTANTLAYAITTLAASPEWQDWIIEEIDEVQRSLGDAKKGYEDIFPQLERCLALMFETLRRFTPVAHISKKCIVEQTIRSGDKIYQIPADTRVTCVFQGVHEQREVWGEDQAVFRPSRWIDPNMTATIPAVPTSIPQAPNLQPPVKGAFLPWSAGPRVCPGLKMAEVEFISVIWNIFKDYRVSATRLDGESLEQAEKRLRNVMLNSEPLLTLQMKKPEDAVMTWIKRERS